MRSLLAAILIAGLTIQASPSQAREEHRLEPSSQWMLDYGSNSCRMARQFGEGEHKVLLIMDQFAPGDSFKLMFIGESVMPKHRIRPINAALQFGPAEQESAITGIEGLFDKQRSFIVNGGVRIAPFSPAEEEAVSSARRNETYFEPRPIEASREKAATWIALKELMEFDLVLHTGPMDKPMNALRECSWDLLGDWGLDVATQKS